MFRILIAFFLLISASALPADVMKPGKTWVFIVCLMEWQDSESYPSFPKENRRDVRLAAAFKSMGVPQNHVRLIQDRAATRKAIVAEYRKMLAQTQKGDTLTLYYTGHGYRDEKRFAIVPYDGKEWWLDQIVGETEKGFRGDKVILIADCCHSGSLIKTVRYDNLKHQYAALGSSRAKEESTGNWTFTDRLLEALKGDPCADSNQDGVVTLKETGNFIRREMKFAEDQDAGIAESEDFPKLELRRTARQLRKGEGDLVVVKQDGELWKARVLERRKKTALVRWLGLSEDYPDEVVPLKSLQR